MRKSDRSKRYRAWTALAVVLMMVVTTLPEVALAHHPINLIHIYADKDVMRILRHYYDQEVWIEYPPEALPNIRFVENRPVLSTFFHIKIVYNHGSIATGTFSFENLQRGTTTHRATLNVVIMHAVEPLQIQLFAFMGGVPSLFFDFSGTPSSDASYSFEVAFPAEADYYRLALTVLDAYLEIDFTLFSAGLLSRQQVALVTKYSFKTGFGQDNPIVYRGPSLPPSVEQSVSGMGMLVESMLVRQYSVHLLPDWAVRGEIANGLVGWVHMQPTNIFGMGVPGQRWEEPPSGTAISPNEVVFTGKIRSEYNPFFNQRIPFPFAPYYEFPTIFEIPLDHGRTGGSTVSGLENATFLLQMDIGLDDSVVLSPPWFEEGDIVSYVYPISLALGSIPFIPKLRQLFVQLKHVPDEISRVFREVTGRSPPPAEQAALREAVEEGFQRVMKEEVVSTRLHIENAPRMPTRQELANMDEDTRILYDKLAYLVSTRQDYAQVLSRLADRLPILRDREFVTEILEKVREYARTYEGTPTPITRRAAEYLDQYFLRRSIFPLRFE